MNHDFHFHQASFLVQVDSLQDQLVNLSQQAILVQILMPLLLLLLDLYVEIRVRPGQRPDEFVHEVVYDPKGDLLNVKNLNIVGMQFENSL
jgi:hypothetical protein